MLCRFRLEIIERALRITINYFHSFQLNRAATNITRLYIVEFSMDPSKFLKILRQILPLFCQSSPLIVEGAVRCGVKDMTVLSNKHFNSTPNFSIFNEFFRIQSLAFAYLSSARKLQSFPLMSCGMLSRFRTFRKGNTSRSANREMVCI